MSITIEKAQANAAAIKAQYETSVATYKRDVAVFQSAPTQNLDTYNKLLRHQRTIKRLKLRYRYAAKLATPQGVAQANQREQETKKRQSESRRRLSQVRKEARKKRREYWSAPCTLTPGTIVVVSGGYDATYHTFYEVMRTTKSYAFVKELKRSDTDVNDGYPHGLSTPLLGQYESDELIRWRASGTELKAESRLYSSQVWDGTPQEWRDLR